LETKRKRIGWRQNVGLATDVIVLIANLSIRQPVKLLLRIVNSDWPVTGEIAISLILLAGYLRILVNHPSQIVDMD